MVAVIKVLGKKPEFLARVHLPALSGRVECFLCVTIGLFDRLVITVTVIG